MQMMANIDENFIKWKILFISKNKWCNIYIEPNQKVRIYNDQRREMDAILYEVLGTISIVPIDLHCGQTSSEHVETWAAQFTV